MPTHFDRTERGTYFFILTTAENATEIREIHTQCTYYEFIYFLFYFSTILYFIVYTKLLSAAQYGLRLVSFDADYGVLFIFSHTWSLKSDVNIMTLSAFFNLVKTRTNMCTRVYKSILYFIVYIILCCIICVCVYMFVIRTYKKNLYIDTIFNLFQWLLNIEQTLEGYAFLLLSLLLLWFLFTLSLYMIGMYLIFFSFFFLTERKNLTIKILNRQFDYNSISVFFFFFTPASSPRPDAFEKRLSFRIVFAGVK